MIAAPHPFQLFIQKYVALSATDWAEIEGQIERRTVRKGELILAEGQVCRHLFFIESGLLRFFIQKNGSDSTKFFTDGPYAFTSQKSASSGLPARENIEALEDSVVWFMPWAAAQALLENRAWNAFIRKLVEEVQGFTEDILEQLQTETAENRYRRMLEKNPALLRRIPLRHLASFFGIAPPSLSRIRKKRPAANRT